MRSSLAWFDRQNSGGEERGQRGSLDTSFNPAARGTTMCDARNGIGLPIKGKLELFPAPSATPVGVGLSSRTPTTTVKTRSSLLPPLCAAGEWAKGLRERVAVKSIKEGSEKGETTIH